MSETQAVPQNDSGRQLHDRATRGETLSADEQALLANWYTSQDQAESIALARTSETLNLDAVRAQIEVALAQLAATSQRMQELSAENSILRREVAELRREVLRRQIPQPA
jgi:hypothetical protein